MFEVKLNNKKYKVEFRHFNPAAKEPKLGTNVDPGTLCVINELDNIGGDLAWVNTYTGRSTLHQNDFSSYNKDRGRKISLTNALKKAFPGEENRDNRRLFWISYFGELNGARLSSVINRLNDEIRRPYFESHSNSISFNREGGVVPPMPEFKTAEGSYSIVIGSGYKPETLKVEVVEGGRVPYKKHESDNCWDLYARSVIHSWDENGYLYVEVPLGIKVQPPTGFGIELKVRSSFSVVGAGWYLANSVGEVDESFRGELRAIFRSTTANERYKVPTIDFPYNVGDRIIQMKLVKNYDYPIEIVDKVDETDRGEGGFGSTGKD